MVAPAFNSRIDWVGESSAVLFSNIGLTVLECSFLSHDWWWFSFTELVSKELHALLSLTCTKYVHCYLGQSKLCVYIYKTLLGSRWTGYLIVVSLKEKRLWLKVHSMRSLNRGKWYGWIISVSSGIYSFSGQESG